jgi:putative ABC transport system substrate-binding protein
MDRRGFIHTLASGLLAAPLAAEGQQVGKMPRVGYLSPGSSSDPGRQRRFEAFRQGLRELGYVGGQNIAIEPRWAEGKYDRYSALAADLVRLKVDVIVAAGGRATQDAQQATRTIPIVMSVVIDPLGSGLVASLARPGGNVTGLTIMASDLVGKQFEVLKEVVPKVSRVALLWNPANPGSAPQVREAEGAARALGGAASNSGGAGSPGDRQRLRGDDQGAGGRARGSLGRHTPESAKTDRRTRGEGAPASGIYTEGARGGRRSYGLWRKPS